MRGLSDCDVKLNTGIWYLTIYNYLNFYKDNSHLAKFFLCSLYSPQWVSSFIGERIFFNAHHSWVECL